MMTSQAQTCNLAQAVYCRSRSHPDALAISGERRALTYAQLARLAAGLAQRLQGSDGWRRSSDAVPRVGILASRSVDACIAVLGAAWAGATYVPLGLKLPEERLLTILSLCKLSAIVTDEQGARLLSKAVLHAAPASIWVLGNKPSDRPADAQVAWLDESALGAVEAFSPANMSESDLAYIIFTSGTTGVPKGVMIRAGAARHYIRATTDLLGLKESDRALETCELTFDVSVHNMFCTWEAGASLHILPAARVMNAVKFVRENRITVWNSVPSLVGMLRQVKALSPQALPSLRLTAFGGEQLPAAAVAAWRSAAPESAIYNFYGPTEATVYCLCQQVDAAAASTPGRDVIAIGTPLPGNEAAIVDEKGNVLPAGHSGELAIAGVQLAVGYLGAPELTEVRFPTRHGKRWYLTGDLAMQDRNGVFHWLGRIDNQVKILGHRVELEEIDAHLRVVADADMVATVAWPMVDGAAQGLVAFVGASRVDGASLIRALKARLPHYMIPAQIHAVEKMPLNSNGKVDRKALRQLLAAAEER